MGFFDTYQDLSGGGSFVGADEKQDLINNGVAFTIDRLGSDDENQYGPRWIAFCTIPNLETGDDEERKIAFPKGSGVETRDSMLAQMNEYLSGEGAEPVRVKLARAGRAIVIVAA